MNSTRFVDEITLNVEAGKASQLTELVRGTEQRLLEQITPLVQRQSVALNLASVERIDAAGIAALISLYRLASEAGHRFSVSGASPHVAELLALVGLDRILMSHNASLPSHADARLASDGLAQNAA